MNGLSSVALLTSLLTSSTNAGLQLFLHGIESALARLLMTLHTPLAPSLLTSALLAHLHAHLVGVVVNGSTTPLQLLARLAASFLALDPCHLVVVPTHTVVWDDKVSMRVDESSRHNLDMEIGDVGISF